MIFASGFQWPLSFWDFDFSCCISAYLSTKYCFHVSQYPCTLFLWLSNTLEFANSSLQNLQANDLLLESAISIKVLHKLSNVFRNPSSSVSLIRFTMFRWIVLSWILYWQFSRLMSVRPTEIFEEPLKKKFQLKKWGFVRIF